MSVATLTPHPPTRKIPILPGPCGTPSVLRLPAHPSGLVILARGEESTVGGVSEGDEGVAADLRSAGFGTLRLESGQGTEGVLRATDWAIETMPSLPLGYLGMDEGVAPVLEAAAERANHIRGVVVFGGYPELARALPSARTATLLIVDDGDQEAVECCRRAFRSLRCEKRLRVLPCTEDSHSRGDLFCQVACLAQHWFVEYLPAWRHRTEAQGDQDRSGISPGQVMV